MRGWARSPVVGAGDVEGHLGRHGQEVTGRARRPDWTRGRPRPRASPSRSHSRRLVMASRRTVSSVVAAVAGPGRQLAEGQQLLEEGELLAAAAGDRRRP